jgi:hypothetical protein
MDFFNTTALQKRHYAPLQPRSYIASSNQETLVLNSTQLDTRLTFVNNITSYVAAASCNAFVIQNSGNQLLSLYQDTRAHLSVPGDITSSNFISSTPSQKQIVLSDYGTPSQYAGFGYIGGGVYYQTPSPIGKHVFQAGITSNSSKELMRIQLANNVPQVGIGIPSGNAMNGNVALQVTGSTLISGDLILSGNFSNSQNFISANKTIPVTALPSNLAFLNSNNTLDSSLVPNTYNFQFLKSQKNVGIGTAKPVQKLQVQGSIAVSDRIAVGSNALANPKARIHAIESFASIPTMILENDCGGNIMSCTASNNAPAFYVQTAPFIGVGIGTSNIVSALTVNGDITISGTLNVGAFTVASPTMYDLNVVDSNTLAPLLVIQTDIDQFTQQPVRTLETSLPAKLSSGIITNLITMGGLTTDIALNGNVRVTGSTRLAQSPIVSADPQNLAYSYNIPSALARLTALNGCICSWNNAPESASLLYQDVYNQLQQCTGVFPDGSKGIIYDGIIALIVEAIKELVTMIH